MSQPGKTVAQTTITTAVVMMPHNANPLGNVHGGEVMKLVDNISGALARRHSGRPVVTASIDRLDFLAPVYVGDLLIIKASINLVARSSMEIGARVEAENSLLGTVRHTASAYLTFVALDENGRPTSVPPLILETPEDHRRNAEAQLRRQVRLADKKKRRS